MIPMGHRQRNRRPAESVAHALPDGYTLLQIDSSNAINAKSVSEFIAYAKANPGKINMASGGAGTTAHMAGKLFC
jgi:hypothetical protein